MSIYDDPGDRRLCEQRLDKVVQMLDAKECGDTSTSVRLQDEMESEDAWARVIKDCRPVLRFIGYAFMAWMAWLVFHS